MVTPEDPNDRGFVRAIAAVRPTSCFRSTTGRCSRRALLSSRARGAFNMHGSLLPKYRGRVPVNWAVINGERETGATLHEMVEKPDAGAIVDQQAVPILPDDTAREVFGEGDRGRRDGARPRAAGADRRHRAQRARRI